MTKVIVHGPGEIPARDSAKAATQFVYVTDAKGRKLGLRAGESERGFAQLIAEW